MLWALYRGRSGVGLNSHICPCVQLNPHVKELSLYDIGGTEGVACDISHCNTKAIAKVRASPGGRQLAL